VSRLATAALCGSTDTGVAEKPPTGIYCRDSTFGRA